MIMMSGLSKNVAMDVSRIIHFLKLKFLVLLMALVDWNSLLMLFRMASLMSCFT